MARRWARLADLPWPERWLLLESWIFLGLMRLAVLCLPFRWTLRLLGMVPGETPPSLDPEAVKAAGNVGWSVRAASNVTPWRSACIEQALAGICLLRQKGIPGTLYLGVAKDPTSRAPLSAHAWLRCGGEILTGDGARELHKTLSAFRPGRGA